MPATDAVIREAAPAKLNLALHVTGRRADGYHLLDSLVAFAAIGDHVTLRPGPLSLSLEGPFAADLGAGADNLCHRAARLAGGTAAITLTKTLPVASGIGGGSADAAAVLRGLARMGHPIPRDVLSLGADVPVCVASAPARMQGIGEIVTPLDPLPDLALVLVNPGMAVATPQVFAARGPGFGAPLPPMPRFGEPAALMAYLAQTRNDLQAPAIAVAPVIAEVLAALAATGAAFARMSGSGATCFGIYDTPAGAQAAARTLSARGWWAVPTHLAKPRRGG